MSTETGSKPRPTERWPEIPGYQIEREIGRGATGVVYRARQLAVGREVALKVLHRELSAKPRVVHRLQREARTTARLNHPHIVTAIDMGEVEGLWWFAMELVDGSSLAVHLRQEGRLKERHALRLFIPLCEALQYAWEQGVVHRDVKPSNILLDRLGGARLADLGLAFRDDDPLLTSTGDTLGTPHYISPEQARDSSTADVRSDIWSFGATLFHAVCGRPPFAGESVAEVLSGVLYAQIPDPRELEPSLSQGLSLVLRKCLSRDPDLRYQTPRELLLDLERVRERRQPKVLRRDLEPLARSRYPGPWAVALALGSATALLVWLAAERPWERGAPDDASRGVASPLDELRSIALAEGRALSKALDRLESLHDELPEESLADWRDARSALRERARAELVRVRERAQRAVDTALASGDFAAAEAALDVGLRTDLTETTGLQLERVPAALSDLPSWALIRAKEVAAARLARAGLSAGLASWCEVSVLPRVERLESEGRWRSAFEALSMQNEELLAGAHLGAALARPVPPVVFAEARAILDERLRRLEDTWAAVDAALARDLEQNADALQRDIDERRTTRHARELLEGAFATVMAQRGIVPEELPSAPQSLCLTVLAERGRALALAEDQLLRSQIERRFRDVDAAAALLMREREYDGAVALWGNLADELLSEAGASPSEAGPGAWRPGVERLLDLRIGEARRLAELLERAEAGVRALDGATVRLYVSTQRVEGRLVSGPDPGRAGFRLISEDGLPFLIQLRRVRTDDLEQLFLGWPERPEAMERPSERLTRALLRFREGDFDAAGEVLASGPLPPESSDLTVELESRIQAAREIDRVRSLERTRRAIELLARALGPVALSDTDGRLLVVESLLRDFADLEPVSTRAPELRTVQKELRKETTFRTPRDEDFGSVYGASAVEMLDAGRVRLTFAFAEGRSGSWQPGSWVGWAGSSAGANWEDLLARSGPSLELVPPLAVSSGDLELELELEQPDTSGEPALLVVSMLGIHFALAGRGLSPPQVGHSISAVPMESFLAGIRSGAEVAGGEQVLVRGARHHLRFRLDRRRRVASIEIRDLATSTGEWRLVAERRFLKAEEEQPRIVLRSWEPVRLIAATIEGQRAR